MDAESPMLSLTLEVANSTMADSLADMVLFEQFQSAAVELLKNDAISIHHFGMVPDNGADGIDECMFDGTLFRFDVNQDLLGIDEDCAPHLIKQAFLTVVENRSPVYSTVLMEEGECKIEKTIVFHYEDI